MDVYGFFKILRPLQVMLLSLILLKTGEGLLPQPLILWRLFVCWFVNFVDQKIKS